MLKIDQLFSLHSNKGFLGFPNMETSNLTYNAYGEINYSVIYE